MGSTTTEYIEVLLKYLDDESKAKKGKGINIVEWNLVGCKVETTPQQQNSFDCGVFVIMFADYILDNIPFLYLDQKDIPYFRKKICLHITVGNLTCDI